MTVIAGDPVNPKNEFWWSEQFRTMLGFIDERDFPNVLDSWSSRLHPDDKEHVLEAFAAHLTDRTGRTPYDIEYRLKLKNGSLRWYRATGTTIRGADGVPLRVAGALKDIHDEKETALELENLVAAAAAGDLTHRIATDKLQGVTRTMGEKMNRLLDSIADSFRTVKVAIEQVGQASGQLRTTSQMMSRSSLELNEGVDRSSSELSRVADGVRANAANASMANQLVTETSLAGKSGEERMEQMSSAMSAINASAAQIARIIKVIDEIAFQTNLLALNAAVEAARAGRHGKGFAVVAQAVRNLAERSARAARETAELIEDSTSKVAQGVRIADGTRAALRDIVGNVTKVVDLAGEIATASREQSTALASVSGSMKQATAAAQAGSQQSNEVAAASDELSRQMKVLKEQMDKYRLGAGAASAANRLAAFATPELIEQLLASIRASAALGETNVEQLFRANDVQPLPLQATGSDGPPPRTILPLDRDERGFDDF
jgi:PAS domain S-box-containing protein